ncbi:hypothetical protein KR009_005992 [Drosophila setifemur]|nr:hypothetical protein KR009_005992 [Drosophila setifemur]
MSERSKGDVSARVNNNPNANATRVVKNPLLSASVTGLSFDDFPNKPQLLPAAPPVVHAPPPAPAPVLIAGILNREPKTLVTVGQPSSIDDSEALDEINLNTSSEDSTGLGGSSPYRGASDPNANPLLEPPPGASNDSLLSQAASSFTALPSVASNVFSTFSRIYAGSREPSEEPRLDIQPAYIQQANYAPPAAALAPPVPAPFYAAPPAAAHEVVAPEPPKFYAPAEVPTSNLGPPPTAGNPNTYRLAARKKLYAPIPGFSEQTGQAAQAPQATQAPLPFQTPPYPAQADSALGAAPNQAPFDISAQVTPNPPPVEERKTGGGLFSLTSLVPQGVLQNISGLVQSATGRTSESGNSLSSNPPPPSGGYLEISSGPPAPAPNFFGGPPPTAGNYFTPGVAPAAQPVEVLAPPSVGGFFAPPTSVPLVNPTPEGLFTPAAPPPVVGGFFPPAPTSIGQYPGAPPLIGVPPAVSTTVIPGNQLPGAPPSSAAGFFNPGGVPPVVTSLASTVPTPLVAPQPVNLPPSSEPGNLFTPGAVPPVIGPPAGAFLPPNPNPLPGAPPISAAPPPAAGQASYRLQKGTRLYKSPLTAQETAAAPSAYAPPLAPASAGIFSPFGAPAPGVFTPVGQQESQGVAIFAPPVASSILAPPLVPSIPSVANYPAPSVVNPPSGPGFGSVPLFAAPPTSSAIPFFNPEQKTEIGEDLIQKEISAPPTAATEPVFQDQSTNQGIPFFSPPPPATAGIALFTPQNKQEETSSKEETNQGSAFFAPPTSTGIQLAESGNSVPLFAAPQEEASVPSNSLFASQDVPLFAPAVIEPVLEDPPASSASLFAPSSELNQGVPAPTEVPLFVPVPATADQSQGVPLYPPLAVDSTVTSENFAPPPASTSASFFAPDLVASTGLPASASFFTPDPAAPIAPPPTASSAPPLAASIAPPPTAYSAPPPAAYSAPPPAASFASPPAASSSSFFAPDPTAPSAPLFASESPAAEIVAAASAVPSTAAPPIGFFGTPEASTTNLFQDNSGTQTVFSPFAQTITTPLVQEAGQDLVPPPFGFVAPQSETGYLGHPPLAPSPLQSFFAAAPGAASTEEFNFFGGPAPGSVFPDLPAQHGIAPPPLVQEPPKEVGAPVAGLGFDQLLSQTQQAQEQIPNSIEQSNPNSSVNAFPGCFGGSGAPPQASAAPEPAAAPASVPLTSHGNPVNFFDQVPQEQEQPANEDQRIQNFFNNPPLQDQPAAPGELKYDIVHSGLAVKQDQERSQTPISNLVEPPSSACSEFSTLAPAPVPTPADRQTGEDLLQQHLGELPEEILKQLRMATASDKGQAATPPVAIPYSPVVVHWFYKRAVDTKFIWTPFSHYDSALLETSLNYGKDGVYLDLKDELIFELPPDDPSLIVPVEGGRYDVHIKDRTKTPVYWEGKAIEVRRCSWFYKGVDSKYVPYSEDTAALLEAEYKHSAETGEWHQKILLANGEQVVFHGPTVIVHFLPQQNGDTWGASTQSSMRPRVVKRDLDDFTIEQGESQRVDHLLFMVHGIGSACDLKMRSVEEVVDDFRVIAQQLVQSHYKNSTDMGLVGRVEVLPISWHGHLHSEELGIDEKLKSITLESIPRLRNFTNDTLLDVLFYTSPKYCQKIMNTVADALNEVYLKYRMRHPEFNGGVSLAGHSLGSLILFDLLCNQEPLKESEEENMENPDQLPQKVQKVQLPNNDLQPKEVSYTMGPAGTGQPVINYTQLIFHPKKFFALGSPIGMFVTIRGIDKLGLDFHMPTCPGFYNIFHPFDPVAYRIEALVNPDMNGIRPVLIPHHKGRKRMHLELKETMTRVGADIKQRFMDTFKTTLDSVNFLATVTKVKKEAEESLEKETSQTSNQTLQKQLEDPEESSGASSTSRLRNRTDSNSTTASDPEFVELDFPLGKLNDSKRVDYVLQEAPLEFINEYIFALSSHVCYWGSEDTILFVMKEIYASLGISTDSQVPQSSMTIERPASHESGINQALLPM